MGFKLEWLPEARGAYDAVKAAADAALESRKAGRSKSSKQEGLFKQLHKCLTLLSENPRHPGLKTHKYYSLKNPFDDKQPVFEAYAQHKTPAAYRVFWCYGPEKRSITIMFITSHP